MLHCQLEKYDLIHKISAVIDKLEFENHKIMSDYCSP